MTAQSNRCHYCENAATKLCDFQIGLPIGGIAENRGKKFYTVDIGRPFFTCDRPLCDQHSTEVGRLFWSGEGTGGVDSFDRCPDHASTQEDPQTMTDEEADVIRRRLSLRIEDGKVTLSRSEYEALLRDALDARTSRKDSQCR